MDSKVDLVLHIKPDTIYECRGCSYLFEGTRGSNEQFCTLFLKRVLCYARPPVCVFNIRVEGCA